MTRAHDLDVDLVGGMLIAMWNYMGWDNASTIAVEVDQPQRTYPRAMLLVWLLVVAELHSSRFGDAAYRHLAHRLGRRDLGPILRHARRPAAACCAGAGRNDERFRNVQRAGDELFAVAVGHGAGRHVAARFSPESHSQHSGSLGFHSGLRAGWALCLGWASSGWSRIDVLIYGASLLLEFVALVALRFTEPDLPRPFKVPGGMFGSSVDRHASYGAAGLRRHA